MSSRSCVASAKLGAGQAARRTFQNERSPSRNIYMRTIFSNHPLLMRRVPHHVTARPRMEPSCTKCHRPWWAEESAAPLLHHACPLLIDQTHIQATRLHQSHCSISLIYSMHSLLSSMSTRFERFLDIVPSHLWCLCS